MKNDSPGLNWLIFYDSCDVFYSSCGLQSFVEEQKLELPSSMYSRPTLRGKMGTLVVNMAAEGVHAEDMAAEDMAAEGMVAEGMVAEGMAAEGMLAEGMLAESMAAESTTMRNCDFVDISAGQRGLTRDKTEQH